MLLLTFACDLQTCATCCHSTSDYCVGSMYIILDGTCAMCCHPTSDYCVGSIYIVWMNQSDDIITSDYPIYSQF